MKPNIRKQFCRQSLFIVLTAIAMTALATEAVMAVPIPSIDKVQRDAGYGRIPLVFIPNQGQFDKRVDYVIQGKDKSIYFTPEGLTFVLTERINVSPEGKKRFLREIDPGEPEQTAPRKKWVVKLDFVGARQNVRPESLERSDTVISYFKGHPEEWKTGLRTSSKIIYRGLWPGIDLIYYGTVNRMKYDFIVRPGADPSRIRLSYRGADSVEVTQEGRLEVSTPLGVFQDDVPVAWQDKGGKREGVSMAYALEKAPSVQVAAVSMKAHDTADLPGFHSQHQGYLYGFTVGPYDRSRPLVLDPEMLVYCGYIGGSGTEYGYGIAVDSAGYAYVTGYTDSTAATFPVLVGPDLTDNGDHDAFVAKVSADGTTLVYCGYIGGSRSDYGNGIAVDGSGNAYVVGYTTSPDPPTAYYTGETPLPVVGGPDLTSNGGYDAFVAKVNADGTALVYCGYVGGSNYDSGQGIAVDGSGNAYITGITASKETDSNPFPLVGGLDSTYNGGTYDAFVTKIKADGTGLIYSGYMGGDNNDRGYGIAVDGAGCAYVTGYTRIAETLTFPQIVGPYLTHKGGDDAFVAKVNADGTGLIYSGYIGGNELDRGFGIAVDGEGCAYVTGDTTSNESTFPSLVGPGLTFNGLYDAFVAKVNADGSALLYCGYIGGEYGDSSTAIAVDGTGNAYVTGDTESDEDTFPVVGGPRPTYSGGNRDTFASKVKADGTGFVYSGYIGGPGSDYGKGISVDGSGNAYVIGCTDESIPVTVGPGLIYNGNTDAFVAKIRCIGDLRVDIAGPIDGQWRRVGTDTWRSGGATETGILPGSYTVEFKPVEGWTTPASVEVVIGCGQTTTETGTYVQQLGTAVINPDPDSVNAPWRLTGPYSYSQSGTGDQTLNNLPAGNYTIVWGNVTGWTKPADETKAVTSGGTTTFAGTYTDAGIPQIQITPASLNFGYVPPGSYKDLTVTVKNIGTGILTGAVSASPPFSIVSGGSYHLAANQTQQVVVRYTAPLEEGSQTGLVTFTGGGGSTVQVKGTNIKPRGLPWFMLLLGTSPD